MINSLSEFLRPSRGGEEGSPPTSSDYASARRLILYEENRHKNRPRGGVSRISTRCPKRKMSDSINFRVILDFVIIFITNILMNNRYWSITSRIQ